MKNRPFCTNTLISRALITILKLFFFNFYIFFTFYMIVCLCVWELIVNYFNLFSIIFMGHV